MTASGPLVGTRIVELNGLGPAPFAAMALADLGADVVRVTRPGEGGDGAMGRFDVLNRNRDCIEVDLKDPAGIETVLGLIDAADGFIEGFRPGVCERLGLGPDVLLERNPRLVYGRMTGWGQDGPLAQSAGHDITYAATAGALAHIGRRDQPPTPPLNLVADFGGGGMLLAFGMTAGLLSAARGGRGQVVDAAMVDGVAMLMGALIGASESGFWSDERGTNLLDSGAPYYDCYRCADGRYVAVGAIEAPFFAALVDGLGLADTDLPEQNDQERWPELRAAFEDVFLTRSRDAWAEAFEGTDAWVAPVIAMGELAGHHHLRSRRTVVHVDGAVQPAPAPRFSGTPAGAPRPATAPVAVDAVRRRWSRPAG
ncbi:CaiB/BaiF CoA transferase family protein [Actinospongicola halichondriae]|uniref:CaiB/BaiF CoA transferase family protein n=1 Tax=Actinospongicola halichondriae TaxID=3236844 RepID=UPI003D3C1C4F